MTASKQTTEKKCCFYASDFHLEMTIVPYLNKKIEENKNIFIVTQNKLEETIKVLISRMNIKNKNAILELNWNNSDIPQMQAEDNLVVIVNGSKEFIQNRNREIKEKFNEAPDELIDCYDFNEVKDEMVEIGANYTSILNNLQKCY